MLRCEKVSKRYNGVAAVDGVSCVLGRGRQYALVGPSGAGKTTLARLLCDLEKLDQGSIEKRAAKVLICPQDFVVWPHLSILDNVLVGANRRVANARENAEKWLAVLGLDKLLKRRGDELSYGEQQRVALARGLAGSPDLLILDEPFSNLDPPMKRKAWRDIDASLRQNEIASLWITHSPMEALAVADELLFMSHGEILQQASPSTIYRTPFSLEVAEFFGEISLVEGQQMKVLMELACSRFEMKPQEDRSYGLRPEFLLIEQANEDDGAVKGNCLRTRYSGAFFSHEFELANLGKLVGISYSEIDWSKAVTINLIQEPCEFSP